MDDGIARDIQPFWRSMNLEPLHEHPFARSLPVATTQTVASVALFEQG